MAFAARRTVAQLAGPPGLAPPPGLEGIVAPSVEPNLKRQKEPAHVGQQAHCVRICGLPVGILTGLAMEVVLDEAGLSEAMLGFLVAPIARGQRVGEVVVRLAGPAASEKCVSHFHGRKWSNTEVTAVALPTERVNKENTAPASLPRQRGSPQEEPRKVAAASNKILQALRQAPPGPNTMPWARAIRRDGEGDDLPPSPGCPPPTTLAALHGVKESTKSEPDASTDAGESNAEEEMVAFA
jgi:hypothetical protein